MRCFALGVCLSLFAASAAAAEDEFAPAVRIEAGDGPIDVGGYRGAAPWFGDFDGDGLNDLLVGQGEPARLRVYHNQGTKEEPRFEGFEWFMANGEIAELPVDGTFRPQLRPACRRYPSRPVAAGTFHRPGVPRFRRLP